MLKAIAKKDISIRDIFVKMREGSDGIFYRKDQQYDYYKTRLETFFIYFEEGMSHMFNTKEFNNFFITVQDNRNNKINQILK